MHVEIFQGGYVVLVHEPRAKASALARVAREKRLQLLLQCLIRQGIPHLIHEALTSLQLGFPVELLGGFLVVASPAPC